MSIEAMFAYDMNSEGAKALATALGTPRIRHHGSKFRPSASKTLINWGATTDRFPADYLACRVLNNPTAVTRSVNKLDAFNAFQSAGVSIPDFTTDRNVALNWLQNGHMVFARTQLRAHSGRGIVIMDPEHADTWEVTAPLYVKYCKKKYEYRIHVLNGQVIDTQRKGLRPELQGTEGINFKVRNLANGFIYVRNDNHVVPTVVNTVAVQAVAALGLDFGAADVIYQEQTGRAYCLEVNTAPGLTGTTVDNYAAAFSAL